MFGVANQLLACVALAVATTILINMGKTRYAWVTLLPFTFLATNTLYGGFLNIRDNYWPGPGPDRAMQTQGYVLTICTAIMICAVVILISSRHQVDQPLRATAGNRRRAEALSSMRWLLERLLAGVRQFFVLLV